MGILTCPFPVTASSHSDTPLPSKSSTFFSSSLSSQTTLPSVHSLTPPSSRQHDHQTSVLHHQCLATLRGHSSYVFSLALAGNLLYSGSSNSEIRAWSRDPSAHSHSTNNIDVAIRNIGAVKSLVIMGDKLFSAHQDCKIRVWKIDNDNNVHQEYNCIAIATLPTMNDRFLRFFSEKNYVQVRRHKKCTWVHHVDNISALAISRDGSLLFSSSWDRTFKVWRTSDFRCLESVSNAHDDAINAIISSNDGFVYTGSADKKIKVWKKQAREKKHSLVTTMERHKSAVNALGISTDGCVLYSGACDRSVLVWERDTSNSSGGTGGHAVVADVLRGHTEAILCLAVVSDLVCSGSADSTVRVWRREEKNNYSCLSVLEGHRRPVKCLTAAIDNGDNNGGGASDSIVGTSYLIYSGSLDCDIRIWHIY